MFTTRVVSIDDLKADPANVRQHPEQNKRVTRSSLKRFGAVRSIVIDGHNVVLAGSMTLEAARAAGIREVVLIESDGKKLIAIQRKDLQGSDATAYALADNRSSDLSLFDADVLADQLQKMADDGISLEDLGWNPDQLDLQFDESAVETVDESDVSRLDEKTKLKCPKCGHEFEA